MPREQQNPQSGQGMGQGAPGMGGGADQGAVGGGPGTGSADQTQTNGPGGGVAGAVPIGTPDPLQKYKWYIFSALGLALVIAAAFMLRAKPGQTPSIAAAEPSPLIPTLPPGVKATAVRAQTVGAVPANGVGQKAGNTSATLAALKEELFQLETERLEGKISHAEYAEHKAALEVLLKRALARQAVTQ